jgi:hypothetical protein
LADARFHTAWVIRVILAMPAQIPPITASMFASKSLIGIRFVAWRNDRLHDQPSVMWGHSAAVVAHTPYSGAPCTDEIANLPAFAI